MHPWHAQIYAVRSLIAAFLSHAAPHADHYHVTADMSPPYTIRCLKGCIISSESHRQKDDSQLVLDEMVQIKQCQHLDDIHMTCGSHADWSTLRGTQITGSSTCTASSTQYDYRCVGNRLLLVTSCHGSSRVAEHCMQETALHDQPRTAPFSCNGFARTRHGSVEDTSC
jgi:hypothetical protein